VNDVLVDPAQHSHVMIATDRSGVMTSNNSGETFTATNRGFAHRQVASVLVDRDDSSTIYAGLINDKEFGGVFVTHDGGSAWQQLNSGLNGRDVFSLRQSPKGELIAGTNHGVMALRQTSKNSTPQWTALDNVINIHETVSRVPAKSKAKPVITRKTVKSQLLARVNDIEFLPERWFAATSAGIFITNDEGRTWHGGPVENESDFLLVKASSQVAVAATRKTLLLSVDGGNAWYRSKLPENVTTIADIAMDEKSNIFLAAREGAYRSEDGGTTWQYLRRLPVNQLASMIFDQENGRLLAISHTSTEMFESYDAGRTWKRAETGWKLRAVRSARGRVIATTAFDGIVAQPDSASASTASASSGTSGMRGSNK
jgi:photosystem II stability/assembly factor-like uncharacterized protein